MKKVIGHVVLIMLLFTACSKAISEEQIIVKEFNSHAYDFSLSYSDGQYELTSNKVISANEIQSSLSGQTWRIGYVGWITPAGYTEDHSVGGNGLVTLTFIGDKVKMVTKMPPLGDILEQEEAVLFGTNSLSIGEIKMLVCSISDTKVYYLEATHYDNFWHYKCLEKQ